MMGLLRIQVLGFLVLVVIAAYGLWESRGHFREGRRGVGLGITAVSTLCALGAVWLWPRVLDVLKDVGFGVW